MKINKGPNGLTVNEQRRARVASKLTQQQVAEKAGIALVTVVRAERLGKWPTRFDTRRRYCRALKIEVPA